MVAKSRKLTISYHLIFLLSCSKLSQFFLGMVQVHTIIFKGKSAIKFFFGYSKIRYFGIVTVLASVSFWILQIII